MEETIIKIMAIAGYPVYERNEHRLLFNDDCYEDEIYIAIDENTMLEKTIEIILKRARERGKIEGRFEVQKIISDYKKLMQ